jgi:hypothetical protein
MKMFRATGKLRAKSKGVTTQQEAATEKPEIGRVKVFRTLTMPNGKGIRVMREDAFRNALSASRKVRA